MQQAIIRDQPSTVDGATSSTELKPLLSKFLMDPTETHETKWTITSHGFFILDIFSDSKSLGSQE